MLFQRRFLLKNKTKYKDAGYPCINPFQGWYRPYIYDLSQKFNPEEQRWCLHEEEPLCLVEISLEAYRNGNLPEEALTRLCDILGLFREHQKQVILRFSYDTSGEAMTKEPTELERILKHMEQISGITKTFAPMILCYQGLFIGNWGEMHGSRYITDGALQRLYEGFRTNFGNEAILAVRRLGWMQHWQIADDNVTLFDDGIFGSDNDLGTFLTDREEALTAIEHATRMLPVGGELLSQGLHQNLFSKEQILSSLRSMHISYLNNQYDPAALHYLEEHGILDEVKKQTGYRLLIEAVERQAEESKVVISNVGWGDAFLPIVFELYTASGEILRQEVRGIRSGEQVQLVYANHQPAISFCGKVRGIYPICFANNGKNTFELGE